MIEIKDLLARFSNLLLGEELKKESIIKAIGGVIGLDIEKKDVKIKGQTVFLNIKPIYKSEILLKRDKINTKLAEVLGVKAPDEFR